MNNSLEVKNKYSQEILKSVSLNFPEDSEQVLSTAEHHTKTMAAMPRHVRSDILLSAAELVRQRSRQFAKTISEESGKPINQAQKEVERCINTLTLSAEEAKRKRGEIIPFDSYAGNENRFGYFMTKPLGIILAITPYNDPLNLVAHKVGPAIAGGNSIILKPSEKAPLSALMLAECFSQAKLPKGCLQVIIGNKDLLAPYLSSNRVRMVSFTGGVIAGELISKQAGLKKLSMDLGGNAANIVLGDCDIASAVAACVSGAYWANGQNCISVQRIIIEKEIHDSFVSQFVDASRKLIVGNPLDKSTSIGPLIDNHAADRINKLVDDAIYAGAKLEYRGPCTNNVMSPIILSNVPRTHKLWLEEIFGPVVCIHIVDDFENAISVANDPSFSLHAAIFTNRMNLAFDAIEKLDAGGVMINDSSDFRFDGMPFGGSKFGSMGREGVGFAVQDMTQTKVVCFNN